MVKTKTNFERVSNKFERIYTFILVGTPLNIDYIGVVVQAERILRELLAKAKS